MNRLAILLSTTIPCALVPATLATPPQAHVEKNVISDFPLPTPRAAPSWEITELA